MGNCAVGEEADDDQRKRTDRGSDNCANTTTKTQPRAPARPVDAHREWGDNKEMAHTDNFPKMKISEHLTLMLMDGRARFSSTLGMSRATVLEHVQTWLDETPQGHKRRTDVLQWLTLYEEQGLSGVTGKPGDLPPVIPFQPGDKMALCLLAKLDECGYVSGQFACEIATIERSNDGGMTFGRIKIIDYIDGTSNEMTLFWSPQRKGWISAIDHLTVKLTPLANKRQWAKLLTNARQS